jgi:hypothetical protein
MGSSRLDGRQRNTVDGGKHPQHLDVGEARRQRRVVTEFRARNSVAARIVTRIAEARMMNETVYARLTEAAKRRIFISYSELGASIQLSLTDATGVNALSEILEAIADNEISNGRPLLVAIIINENTNMPGAGLFNYAKRKGLMKPKDKDTLSFFVGEAKKVHDYWSKFQE